ncbi:hypothetical protein SS50377_21302 [Spironucleus salmonicida]|uniref:Uncharacterized protein n=1 Tax=Spironucleus salmonicida TaxID=348837 RepID=A0A9P8S0K2_9EUKA|nr:hypothetical protein SS50377_21302 [Spironucleus salmonicida]
MSPGTQQPKKAILTSNTSTGYAEDCMYSIFNTRMMHNLSKMIACSLTWYVYQHRSIGMDEFQMVTTTHQDEFYQRAAKSAEDATYCIQQRQGCVGSCIADELMYFQEPHTFTKNA